MTYTGLRIHPAIGIARVGNSEEYYLGPETMAGMDVPGQTVIKGGLPIQPGTENTTIRSTDLRDSGGRLKRQAARFRIYQYAFADDAGGAECYPANAQAVEVKIGDLVDGKAVKDIVWTVHLANKKAASWKGGDGVEPFGGGKTPALRNATFQDDLIRRKKLIIDAGPRALSVASPCAVQFDASTPPSYAAPATGAITALPDYPVAFPSGSAPTPGKIIQTLGAAIIDGQGRLLVLGGHGLACGFDDQGNYSASATLPDNVNNDNWFDDTADGPVTAILIFADGTVRAVEGSAWVISSDPSYAPQTANVVSLWDDLYCTWLQQLALQPAIYRDGKYQTDFQPDFSDDIYPLLRATSLQKWNTSLPSRAIREHDRLGNLNAESDPEMIRNVLRNPNKPEQSAIGSPRMPLSLGDAGKGFLSVTPAQYFIMGQWQDGLYSKDSGGKPALGAGEALDRTVLFNCLGGRFSPGIEMSFIVRDANLYKQTWSRHDDGGPFRINMQPLDYAGATKAEPLLDTGYTPLRSNAVQPGDLCKFMAVPWHTDYNSCATHMPEPNPGGPLTPGNVDQVTSSLNSSINTLLYSSWPAQRPVAIYTYDDVVANEGKLAVQRFSVRGEGTQARSAGDVPPEQGVDLPAMYVGRYQERQQFLDNWHRVGVVMQAAAVVPPPDATLNIDNFYLEVASQFDTDASNLVEYWRNTVIDTLYPPPKTPG